MLEATTTKSSVKKTNGTELREPQIRILQCLARHKQPLTRKQIAEKAKIDPTKVGDYVDRPEGQSEETASRWKFSDLKTLKLVRVEVHDLNGKDTRTYTITPKGKTIVTTQKV